MSEKKNSRSKFLLPENADYYFNPASDDAFKRKHPVGYVFLVVLGLIALITPMIVYGVYVIANYGNDANLWFLLGLFGSMSIGVCLFNFVAIIIKQYLGHLVSIISFLFGMILILISLSLM